MSEPETIPIVARALLHGERTALRDQHESMSYAQLLRASAHAARHLLGGRTDLDDARVAFLVPPGVDYVVTQWGIWRAGGIAVPLCVSHPRPELEHSIGDSGASILVAHPELRAALEPIAHDQALQMLSTEHIRTETTGALPSVASSRGAMLLYTSGTTGKPKGVLSTHAVLRAQVESVIAAWEISSRDRILHVLPLHHLHGVLNSLCCTLYAGGCCELIPRFDAGTVLDRIGQAQELTLFMAVPTIYAKLIDAHDAASAERSALFSAGCARLRLMVSGSAALPEETLRRFREISSHTLLERYGMTEFGMGLGNPLHGERRPGHVGACFPGVEARLMDEREREVHEGEPGKLEVKSAGMFAQYWGKPAATAESFTPDGWFKTGDVAQLEHGSYRILGRESVDILKSGGYKISALEIEATLRAHPAIRECAVIGVPDPTWGQRVAAVAVLHEGAGLELAALREWAKQRLAPYKVPSLLRTVKELPKNAMGKVQKPELAVWF
ncbi:MAG: acyl-CoA synthetase [Polyangiales bacterium]